MDLWKVSYVVLNLETLLKKIVATLVGRNFIGFLSMWEMFTPFEQPSEHCATAENQVDRIIHWWVMVAWKEGFILLDLENFREFYVIPGFWDILEIQ